jgi:hypothetical protein
MYETIHIFTMPLPAVADLFTFSAALSPVALVPFGVGSFLAVLFGLTRRSVDERSPKVRRDRRVRPAATPRAAGSTPLRNHSSTWISRTGGIVRL